MNKTDTNLDEINYECEKLNADGNKYNIKICTWNVSGIRAVIKVIQQNSYIVIQALTIQLFFQKNGMEYLKREDADIVALQETKCETIKIPTEAKLQGYKRYYLESKLVKNLLKISPKIKIKK